MRQSVELCLWQQDEHGFLSCSRRVMYSVPSSRATLLRWRLLRAVVTLVYGFLPISWRLALIVTQK